MPDFDIKWMFFIFKQLNQFKIGQDYLDIEIALEF